MERLAYGVNFVKGDIISDVRADPNIDKYIMHVCNDIGAWGAGFVRALDRRWPIAGVQYRLIHNNKPSLASLGNFQVIDVEPGIWVVNLIAQRDIRSVRCQTGEDFTPLRYPALNNALVEFSKFLSRVYDSDTADAKEVQVICPLMGAGLAGGDWDTVETLITGSLAFQGWPVDVFVLPNDPNVGKFFPPERAPLNNPEK